MRISPDSMEEVTAMQSGNGTQGSGQQHASNGSETTNQ
jgi:hypothetical protein